MNPAPEKENLIATTGLESEKMGQLPMGGGLVAMENQKLIMIIAMGTM